MRIEQCNEAPLHPFLCKFYGSNSEEGNDDRPNELDKGSLIQWRAFLSLLLPLVVSKRRFFRYGFSHLSIERTRIHSKQNEHLPQALLRICAEKMKETTVKCLEFELFDGILTLQFLFCMNDGFSSYQKWFLRVNILMNFSFSKRSPGLLV